MSIRVKKLIFVGVLLTSVFVSNSQEVVYPKFQGSVPFGDYIKLLRMSDHAIFKNMECTQFVGSISFQLDSIGNVNRSSLSFSKNVSVILKRKLKAYIYIVRMELGSRCM